MKEIKFFSSFVPLYPRKKKNVLNKTNELWEKTVPELFHDRLHYPQKFDGKRKRLPKEFIQKACF